MRSTPAHAAVVASAVEQMRRLMNATFEGALLHDSGVRGVVPTKMRGVAISLTLEMCRQTARVRPPRRREITSQPKRPGLPSPARPPGMPIRIPHRNSLPNLRNDHQFCPFRARPDPRQLLGPTHGHDSRAADYNGVLGRPLYRHLRASCPSPTPTATPWAPPYCSSTSRASACSTRSRATWSPPSANGRRVQPGGHRPTRE